MKSRNAWYLRKPGYRRALGSTLGHVLLHVVATGALLLALAGCQFGPTTPPPTPMPTPDLATPTPTPTLSPDEQPLFQTYAHGELLPHMRVPIQRSTSGEGGWYVVIGSEEGWAQFLSQMGQPAEIWEPVQWEDEILVGVLLGVRQGRGHAIAINDLETDGVTTVVEVSFGTPTPEQAASTWITYPFHLIRVPRTELALGPITFRFVASGKPLAEREVDMIDLDIVWLPGETSTYPTPTPVPTLIPEPTPTPTPVPNLQVAGTVLEVITDTLTLRIVPFQSDWEHVELMEGTSIFSRDGQPATLVQLVPGTAISVLGYPGVGEPSAGRTMRAAHIDVLRPPGEKAGFAEYGPRNVSLATIYDGYKLPLSLEGISTTVPLTQTFSLTQTAALTRNGFVVVPASYRTFAALYNDPQYVTYPILISADSVVHVSQLLLDHVWRAVERQHLLPELERLEKEMFSLSWSQYTATQASVTPQEQRMANTAMRNASYFAVAASLLDPEFTPPDVVSPVVNAELSLIAASEAITISPLLDLPGVPEEEKLRVDYAQFAPTGHYARDADLSRYFQAMTWHRTIAFRPDQREETRSAATIAHALATHSAPRVLWQRIHDLLAFFGGRDASLTPPEYGALLAEVWGEASDLTALADEEKLDAFIEGTRGLPLPANPIWTIWEAKQHVDRDWRFFGRPFRVDSYVFQQTTGDHVGDPERIRHLPSGIDLAAVLGSLEAYRVASQIGYAEYMDYIEQVDRVRNELSAVPILHWTGELHWNWLYVYRALLQEKNVSYPAWMHTTAWKRKTLQTTLGNWTHVRHDLDPAVAWVQAEEAASTSAPWGYVEPQPEVYARLAALTRMVIDGLESRLMLPAAEREALLELETWLMFLQDAARRELTNRALSDEEYQRLGEYGTLLDKLTRAAVAEDGVVDDQALGEEYDEAVAVRIAVAPEGQLVEATGPLDQVYVVVERGRQPYLARGGVYAHYEFVWPIEDPLTDARWRELLAAGKEPARPVWVAGFVIAE